MDARQQARCRIRAARADRKNCVVARCRIAISGNRPDPIVENLAAPRIGVLISGRGSNLQAIIDAIAEGRLHATIAVVISNVPGAAGLERARRAGIATRELPHRQWPSRAAYDTALADALSSERVELVCLAGFMRLLTATFLDRFPNRVLNMHPSLLPAFPGVAAQRQALAHGVQVAGATVHLVTPELDAGPIVRQAAVPVFPDDTVESLSARILVEEHRLYPLAIDDVLRGQWRIDGRRFLEDAAAAVPQAPGRETS
jgi:phosphoribosylglycinamide formyltransferase-1